MSISKKIYTPQILIYCEGVSDKYFVNAIKVAYGCNRQFSVQGGQGGSAEEVLRKCINVLGEYEKYCVVDATPKISDELRLKALENKITLIEISPYLECVILNTLNNSDAYSAGYNKNKAKDILKKYKEAGEYLDLENLFISEITITFLKKRRECLGEFLTLVDLFEKYKKSQQEINDRS
ncbi:TPA: hypothetical protein DEP94_02550 [Candidatus Nomurabacteria bacterium]|nr:hypothetical protein [Candidatus Nomurabacteria bacterium]